MNAIHMSIDMHKVWIVINAVATREQQIGGHRNLKKQKIRIFSLSVYWGIDDLKTGLWEMRSSVFDYQQF